MIAVAAVLVIVIIHVQTTLRWLFAALFLTLALNPAVDRIESIHIRGRHPFPRWLSILAVYVITFGVFVFLVLQVVPPIVREAEHLGSKVPGYIADFRQWANENPQFQHRTTSTTSRGRCKARHRRSRRSSATPPATYETSPSASWST